MILYSDVSTQYRGVTGSFAVVWVISRFGLVFR